MHCAESSFFANNLLGSDFFLGEMPLFANNVVDSRLCGQIHYFIAKIFFALAVVIVATSDNETW